MSSLSVYVLTFNCGRKLIKPNVLAPHLLQATNQVPDLFILCLQEIAPLAYSFLGGSFLTPYFDAFKAAIRIANDDYVNIVTHNIGLTAIMIFAKDSVSSHISSVQLAETGVGFQETGHKGAAGVRLLYENTPLTFVSAHLAPGEEAVERRNQDYQAIVERLVFTPSSQDVDSEQTSLLPSDGGLYGTSHIMFAGDLNYRTSVLPPSPENVEQFPQPVKDTTDPLHWSHLLEHDQLEEQQKSNRTLHGLTELPIDFPPTYKYDSKEDILEDGQHPWPWATHRWPSWCDRILYSSGVTPHAYQALPLFGTSDHRPVALSATISKATAPRVTSPYKIDSEWRTKRTAARRKELAIGALSYLTWTKEGSSLLLASIVGILGFSFILRSLLV